MTSEPDSTTATKSITNSQVGGAMTQSSLGFWYSVANGAYLVGVIIAAVGSIGLYFLGNRVSKATDDELRRFQPESAIQITAAKEGTAKALKEAADANKAAEGL